MNSGRLKRTLLTGAMLSLMSFSAVLGAERAAGTRASRPDDSQRRVVPFRSDKTDSWMCNNVSAFWCGDGRATQAPPPSNSNRRRGRG